MSKHKRITIRDVAREAAVSSATVSYVFNGKKELPKETKARVIAAIDKLDYVPNMNARGLSSDSLLIGVLIPQTEPGSRLMFENVFYGEILGSIEFEARNAGYHLLISGAGINENYIRLARKRSLDGIIAIGVYPDDSLREIEKSAIPLVLIDSYCGEINDGPPVQPPNVRIDDIYGSCLAASYLIEKGHENIAFFCGKLHGKGVMEKRLEGYRKAVEEHGLRFNRKNVFEGTISFESGRLLAEALLDSRQKKVSAIFAAADVLALGAMKMFSERNMGIPSDISVMGFDDLKISRYMIPALTTIRQDVALKGKIAVELLVEKIKNPDIAPREEILDVEIVERGSVRDLAGGRRQL
ncbi:MAG: LacI family transcriptional regulator [Treponema sp.]|jgi:LacI family transcriptional regulator|nr:LacI family transcriptional regulator [Treponema sp.]